MTIRFMNSNIKLTELSRVNKYDLDSRVKSKEVSNFTTNITTTQLTELDLINRLGTSTESTMMGL